MISYSERKIFGEREIKLWRRACQFVARLPDSPDEMEHRCHELARAVAYWLNKEGRFREPLSWKNVQVVDGLFGSVDHSWIVLRDCEIGQYIILDVYAVGCLPQVQLVHAWEMLQRKYTPMSTRDDIREHRLQWMIKMMAGGG